MKNCVLTVTVLTALFLSGRVPAADEAPAAKAAAEKRELLSDHQTVAKFTGIKAHRCRGLTALCPDRCGHSGDFASFEIVTYLAYQKPGEYGDPKAETFVFQIEDNLKNPKAPKAVADAARGLKAGDLVRLDWRHEYVTVTEAGGGSTSSPERPVARLEKITQEEADELAKKAAK